MNNLKYKELLRILVINGMIEVPEYAHGFLWCSRIPNQPLVPLFLVLIILAQSYVLLKILFEIMELFFIIVVVLSGYLCFLQELSSCFPEIQFLLYQSNFPVSFCQISEFLYFFFPSEHLEEIAILFLFITVNYTIIFYQMQVWLPILYLSQFNDLFLAKMIFDSMTLSIAGFPLIIFHYDQLFASTIFIFPVILNPNFQVFNSFSDLITNPILILLYTLLKHYF